MHDITENCSHRTFGIVLRCGELTFKLTFIFSGILIGLYKDGQVPGNCRKTVDAMRDYLVQNKY